MGIVVRKAKAQGMLIHANKLDAEILTRIGRKWDCLGNILACSIVAEEVEQLVSGQDQSSVYVDSRDLAPSQLQNALELKVVELNYFALASKRIWL